MTDKVFDQLSKEMAVFAQNNYGSYDKLREFFLYELELRCVSKRSLQELAQEIEPEDKK